MRLSRPLAGFIVLLLVALPAVVPAQIIGPGGVITQSTATRSTTNNNGTFDVFTASIPANLSNSAVHALALGTISTASTAPGTGTLTCVFGGTTVTVMNALNLGPGLSSVPIQIECFVSKISGPGYSPTTPNQVWIQAKIATVPTQSPGGGGAGEAASVAAVDPSATQSLFLRWTFGTANASNTLNIQKGLVGVGP